MDRRVFLICISSGFTICGCEPFTVPARPPVKTAVVGQLSYTPPLLPVVITLDSNCQISLKLGTKLVTPIGVFEPSIAAKMTPATNEMFVVVRRGDAKDAVYTLAAGSHLDFEPSQLIKAIHLTSPTQMILIVPRCNPSIDNAISPQGSSARTAPKAAEAPRPVQPQVSPRFEAPPPKLQPKPESPRPQSSAEPVPDRKPAEKSPIPPPLPITATQVMSISDFIKNFKPHAGSHFARIIHPVTGVEYQISFSLPPGTPEIHQKKNQIHFHYPNKTIVFDFKKNGRLDIDYE